MRISVLNPHQWFLAKKVEKRCLKSTKEAEAKRDAM